MPLVNITRIRLRFVEVAIQAEAEIPAQRAVQAKVSAFGRAFVFMFRRVEIGIPGTVPLATAFFGNDIAYATRRTLR